VRQVGTVDEIRHSRDPVVSQFIEGRADLEGADAGGSVVTLGGLGRAAG
jgi:hypothetical protein